MKEPAESDSAGFFVGLEIDQCSLGRDLVGYDNCETVAIVPREECRMGKRLMLLALAALALAVADSALARGPWRASESNTSGWYFMTPEERIEHQARIRSFNSYAECRAYQLEHHQEMTRRAAAQGQQLTPGRRDVCEHLRPPGPPR